MFYVYLALINDILQALNCFKSLFKIINSFLISRLLMAFGVRYFAKIRSFARICNKNEAMHIFRHFKVRMWITVSVLFQITKLKIDSNPFAKGFRDSSRLTEFER